MKCQIQSTFSIEHWNGLSIQTNTQFEWMQCMVRWMTRDQLKFWGVWWGSNLSSTRIQDDGWMWYKFEFKEGVDENSRSISHPPHTFNSNWSQWMMRLRVIRVHIKCLYIYIYIYFITFFSLTASGVRFVPSEPSYITCRQN